MRLHVANYPDHVADLTAALADTTTFDPREALSRLHGDGLAQIMSYTQEYIKPCTFSAVCPQARLAAELFSTRIRGNMYDKDPAMEDLYGAQVSCDGHLRYWAESLGKKAAHPHYAALSLWWAKRCLLPITLSVENARSDVLTVFREADLLHEVAALSVCLWSTPMCGLREWERDRELEAQEATTALWCTRGHVLCSLTDFPHVQTLSIECATHTRRPDLLPYVNRVLTCVAQHTSITALELENFTCLTDCAALAGAPHLGRLKVYQCGLRSFAGLKTCPTLTDIDVGFCGFLTSLVGLDGLLQLKKLSVIHCDIRSLDGLHNCPNLTSLNLTYNGQLVNFVGLTDVPALSCVIAENCNLQSLDGLQNCRGLITLTVEHNSSLRDISHISGLPLLQTFAASWCNLTSVAVLATCPMITTVDVRSSHELQSLLELAGARFLAKLWADGCDLSDVSGLSSCPDLADVSVDRNERLTSLRGLCGAPRLRKLSATGCALMDIGSEGDFPMLEEASLYCNRTLDSVSALAGAPRLSVLSASMCNLTHMHGLGRCPMLHNVDVSSNSQLSDISGLCGAPALEILDASYCKLRSIDELRSSCPKLTDVRVDGNPFPKRRKR